MLIATLWRDARVWEWRIPLAFLAIKAVAQLGLSIPWVAAWGESAGLRILYLHILLLGFVSLAVFAAVEWAWGRELVQANGGMTAAVLLLIATLLPLTGLMPADWSGRWVLVAAAMGALGPPLVASYMLLRAWLSERSMPEPGRVAVATGKRLGER
jgi:hypothetical protein